MIIVIVGSQGCLGSGFLGLVDILSMASKVLGSEESSHPALEVITASLDGRPVVDGLGRRLDVDKALNELGRCDAILVPGFVPDSGNRPPLLGGMRATSQWIRRQHATGTLVCGSCSGVFLLGEAGLLDNRRCTTTWWLHDELKHRYPKSDASYGAALIEDRRVVTAGGPLSWIDLALFVVRTLCGAEAARKAADFAVVDTTPSTQAVYIPPGHLAASGPFLMEAERAVRVAGGKPFNTRDLARQLAASERTLHRRLKRATGESPKQFIDRVRFETARTSLETTTKTLKQIACAAGYVDEASFRRMFKRFAGMTPGAFRIWAKARRSAGSHRENL